MSKITRTPPPTPKPQLMHTHSKSDPDLPSAMEETAEQSRNVTSRHKRPRIFGSPSDDHDPSKAFLTNFKNELMVMLEDWKLEQQKTLSQLVTDVAHLKLQCSNIQHSNNEIEKKIVSLNQDYEEALAKVSQLEETQKENSNCISNLEKQIQELQLKCRSSAIEIRNVPVMPNEKINDLLQIASCLGQTIQMDLSSSNIRDIYRLPGKPGLTRSILVEFSTVYFKNNVLSAVRTYNKERNIRDKLNTENIGIAGECKPIYVDEHLSPTTKRLFYLARDFAKRNSYDFCWISNGKILIRKSCDTKEVHFVKTEQCLLKLESKQ
ncbi:uncharacterized protein LOC113505992 [Trichoplusia ni]|uniref:Uncharacterized protein LOC113505992 n=1 Tax=Trichoplusia ni TaxID=7111 RepID=A0A7E5WVV0_TRINI|nr:uncharacterized protein LOC113505992 [Trichoplusia ni]